MGDASKEDEKREKNLFIEIFNDQKLNLK